MTIFRKLDAKTIIATRPSLTDSVVVQINGKAVRFADLSETDKLTCVMRLQDDIGTLTRRIDTVENSYSQMHRIKRWIVNKLGLVFYRPPLRISDEAHMYLFNSR